MATLSELKCSKALTAFQPVLDESELPERLIHVSEKMKKWIEDVLPTQQSTWNVEISPLEQVSELFDGFCRGVELSVGLDFKTLKPTGQGVWELKTPDVRIFGWFPAKNCFVAVVAHPADFVKKHQLYQGLIGEVVRFRDDLGLSPPVYIPGDNPDAVVSNYSFPNT